MIKIDKYRQLNQNSKTSSEHPHGVAYTTWYDAWFFQYKEEISLYEAVILHEGGHVGTEPAMKENYERDY